MIDDETATESRKREELIMEKGKEKKEEKKETKELMMGEKKEKQ